MASAWGSSFGLAWANAWGGVTVGGGGSGTSSTAKKPRKKRKHQGWLALEAQIEALNTPKHAQKRIIRKLAPQIEPLTTYEEFDGTDALRAELNRLKLDLKYKEAEALGKELTRIEYEAYIQDEEEAITVLLMLLDYEKAFR